MRFKFEKATKNYYLYKEVGDGINQLYIPKAQYPDGAPPVLVSQLTEVYGGAS